nr:MAG TPA: hypothetical protein [Caudoviricetes sp.]
MIRNRTPIIANIADIAESTRNTGLSSDQES